jgi:tRNA-binding EMAP/Myf-like protein
VTETFQEYSARLLSLSAGQDPLAILASTPARIGALVAGRSAQDLHWTPAPSRWSIAQIVAHLADAEVVGAYRFRMILAAPGTPIQAFDQDGWAREMSYESCDTAASLALFTALRRAQLQLVAGLDAEKLERFGVHAERGKESVRHLIGLYAGHDLNHLPQIERLIAERDPGGAHRAFTPAPVKAVLEAGAIDKIDVRAGTIRAAEPLPGADRLAVLTVDFGDRTRAIVAGIRTERPSLAALAGTQALFVVNLPPKTIRGQLSEGMLFDIGFADGLRPAFAQPEWPVPDGVRAG